MTKAKLLEVFPEINLVKNENMREKCIEAWCYVLESTGWEAAGIEKCPLAHGIIDDNVPENSLSHCRRVVRLCKAACDSLSAWIREKNRPLDEDVLLTGAVMHDIGKFIECRYKDGQVVESDDGEMFRHVISGAYVTHKYGLPKEIVHMVLAHSDLQSPEGPNAKMTPELLLMKKLDHLCSSMAEMFVPLK